MSITITVTQKLFKSYYPQFYLLPAGVSVAPT